MKQTIFYKTTGGLLSLRTIKLPDTEKETNISSLTITIKSKLQSVLQLKLINPPKELIASLEENEFFYVQGTDYRDLYVPMSYKFILEDVARIRTIIVYHRMCDVSPGTELEVLEKLKKLSYDKAVDLLVDDDKLFHKVISSSARLHLLSFYGSRKKATELKRAIHRARVLRSMARYA